MSGSSSAPIVLDSDSDSSSFENDSGGHEERAVSIFGSPLKVVCSERYRYVICVIREVIIVKFGCQPLIKSTRAIRSCSRAFFIQL